MAGSQRSVEIEVKFDVGTETSVPTWDGIPHVERVAPDAVRELDAQYFDTERYHLGHAGFALRRRTGGPDAGWHLKGPRRPDGGRLETQWPLGEEGAQGVPAPALEIVRRITTDELTPTARIRNTRTPYLLLDASGAVVAEFVDDNVTAVDERTGIERAWREWEFELGPAAPTTMLARKQLIEAAATAVFTAGGRPSTSGSKLGRALGLG